MAQRNEPVDFSYYEPVNKVQEEFHTSRAKHKLLMGAYRSGKTYPAVHEALFICYDNPGHEFLVCRNTWDSLTDNVEKDFLEIGRKAKAFNEKDWDPTNHNLILKCGTTVKFRPLSLGRKQFKGMSICGFLIDDPDTQKHSEVIAFLFTRLTDAAGRPPAKYFSTIICANYEGHDWLWKTYMRRKDPGGNGLFAYWWCKTEDNPTLSADYIPTQASIHSKAWMDRYIYMKEDSYSGLVYDEYDPKLHDADLSWCVHDESLYKILIIDLGITHPSVVLSMATDYNNVYLYGEWFKTNQRTHNVGDYILSQMGVENFQKRIIDPKSNARDQTSGVSPRSILRKDFGINTTLANNAEGFGIEIVKGLLTPRDGKVHFFIDPKRCPNAAREIETLSWVAPQMSDFDELGYKEKPKDIDNDCMDCARYGSVYFKKFLKHFNNAEDNLKKLREKNWQERINKLRLYSDNPERAVNENMQKSIKKIHEINKKGLTNNKHNNPVVQYGHN